MDLCERPCAPRRDALALLVCASVSLLTSCAANGGRRGDGAVVADAGTDAPGDAAIGDASLANTPDAEVCLSRLACGSPPICCGLEEDCFRGACVAACASGVRCGAEGTACCGASEVCITDACAMPGRACGDSFDCEAGWFCEPTLGRCLPQPAGELCEVRPTRSDLAPVPEWHWEGASDDSGYNNVLVTPAIADLDHDGTPEVVFTAYLQGALAPSSKLVILSGVDGAELYVSEETGFHLASGVAIGNVDDDPDLEIIALSRLGVSAYDADGTVVWSNREAPLRWLNPLSSFTAPALANFDDDPQAEIAIGGVLLDNDGSILFDGGRLGCDPYLRFCAPVIADLNGDGLADLVGGNRALSGDGTTLWELADMPDGFPAVADIDADGTPEVVAIASGALRILRGSDGSLLAGPLALPGGGIGGPPTVADFDGDGRAEIGAAGQNRYVVFDVDCLPDGDVSRCGSGRSDGILWDVPTQDRSSSITGSSVFDFDGDGRAEVVYNDECDLRVYDGATGAVLMEVPNTSQTAMEYPLVADVDGDGNSEFVVPSNNAQVERDGCPRPGHQGITVYGDASDRWVRTRPIWNQHSYHVTNVLADGQVPATEVNSWELPELNSYRQNVQGRGVFNAPDLVVESVFLELGTCPSTLSIAASIGNGGSLGVSAGVPVAFYLDDGTSSGLLLGVVRTATPLLPGASEVLRFDYTPAPGDTGPWNIRVVVDEDGTGARTVTECNVDNNSSEVAEATCDFLI